MIEINFDGIVGPSHNFAGLSFGNLASATNAGGTSAPRRAALQGLGKMRAMLALGLPQAILLPQPRLDFRWLRALGFDGDDEAVLAGAWAADPTLVATAGSASAMWAANAATVSPASDTADARCHLSVANLSTMLHRAIERPHTERQLRLAFADRRFFEVHAPLPAGLGDEGAANFMRLTAPDGSEAVEIFVHGEGTVGRFPGRQRLLASHAIARRHRLDPARTFFARQSDEAIAAGAFHNDVVAVANGHVLFAHEAAFADRAGLHDFIRSSVPDALIIEVPAARVDLETAIQTYLFNSQLVSLPSGGIALILPRESQASSEVWGWLQELIAGDGPIRRLEVVDVRESMRNGGGPACLRLRVQASPEAIAAIDQRFVLDAEKADRIEAVIEREWPQRIALTDLANPELWQQCMNARNALVDILGFRRGEL